MCLGGWGEGCIAVYICVEDCTKNSVRGASAKTVAAAAFASTNGRGTAVKNVATAASATPVGE